MGVSSMGLEYVFIAYALILGAIFAYMFTVSRRQSRIENEIESLRHVLEGRGDRRE